MFLMEILWTFIPVGLIDNKYSLVEFMNRPQGIDFMTEWNDAYMRHSDLMGYSMHSAFEKISSPTIPKP